MGSNITEKTKRLGAFFLAFIFLILLVQLHQKYNLNWEFSSISVEAMDSNRFVLIEIYRINIPFSIQRVIHMDSWLYNGLVILVNVILATYLNIKRGGIGLLVGLILFFIFSERLMHNYFFYIGEKEYNFFLLNLFNIRQFLEIMPILPFLIDYFSRHPNLKPSKP